MGITFVDTLGSSSNFVELPVEVEGLTVTIRAGSFGVGRVTYELGEDHFFTLDSMTSRCALSVYLVQEKATNEVTLLVDDAPHGQGYRWEKDDPYINLHLFLLADIPPDTSDLATVDMRVFRCVKPKEEVSNG